MLQIMIGIIIGVKAVALKQEKIAHDENLQEKVPFPHVKSKLFTGQHFTSRDGTSSDDVLVVSIWCAAPIESEYKSKYNCITSRYDDKYFVLRF